LKFIIVRDNFKDNRIARVAWIPKNFCT